MNKERGLHELFNDDPERAGALVFGRPGLLKGAAIGAAVPFGRFMLGGYIPLALARDAQLNLPTSYRVPTIPIVPGLESHGEGFRVLEAMPVRSLITSPADGQQLPAGTRAVDVRGHAWAGKRHVREVWLSIDYGQSWLPTTLKEPVNRYAWQHWSAQVALPTAGYYEIWARAVDSEGLSQPFAPANWNPQGYGANAYHRIDILALT